MKGKFVLVTALAVLGSCLLLPSAGSCAQDTGYNITSELWAKAVLQAPSGPVPLVWKEVGSDTTPSGDKVISGYFYADPNDFAYGSMYNPEVFVKVYIATNGWCNMAFNHVTVDYVTIYSAHNYAGTADQTGIASQNNRLVEHQYTGVGVQTQEGYDGSWKGTAVSNISYNYYSEACPASGSVNLTVSNTEASGTAVDSFGYSYSVSGTVTTDGAVTAYANGNDTVITLTGTMSGASGGGTWTEAYGCGGTWTMTKQ
jgi:hypothetical protein